MRSPLCKALVIGDGGHWDPLPSCTMREVLHVRRWLDVSLLLEVEGIIALRSKSMMRRSVGGYGYQVIYPAVTL